MHLLIWTSDTILGEDPTTGIAALKISTDHQTLVSLTPISYRTSFKLTEQSFEALRGKNIPEDILEKLQPFEDEEFISKEEFFDAVKKRIGEKQTVILMQLKFCTYNEKVLAALVDTPLPPSRGDF